MGAEKKVAGVSDSAVKERTGKTWDQWFAILDKAGAKKKTHKEIVAILRDRYGVGPWWQQMVTVGYEQARGLREKYETASGYQTSASKTVAVPVTELYRAWSDARKRVQWLPDSKFTVRKATLNKAMRITWVDGRTNVDANFYAKGERKSQVSVEHSKLANRQEVARMKTYWAKALGRLKEVLEV